MLSRALLSAAALAFLAAAAYAGTQARDTAQAMASTGALDRGYDNSAVRARVQSEVRGSEGEGYRLPGTAAGHAYQMAAADIPTPAATGAPARSGGSMFSGMFDKVKGFFTMKNMITYGAAAAGAIIGAVYFSGAWPVLIGAAVGLAAGWLLAKLFS